MNFVLDLNLIYIDDIKLLKINNLIRILDFLMIKLNNYIISF